MVIFGFVLAVAILVYLSITLKNALTKSVDVSINIPKEFNRFVEDQAARMEISKNEYISQLISIEYEKRLEEIQKEIDEEHIEYVKKHHPDSWKPPEE